MTFFSGNFLTYGLHRQSYDKLWIRKISYEYITDQSKSSADFFIDYCSIMVNIEEQCGEIFVYDIYLMIYKDKVLNNFDSYFILTYL